jgi:pSer/pThr/pTyr-binding forkhead associated (FHA) protein
VLSGQSYSSSLRSRHLIVEYRASPTVFRRAIVPAGASRRVGRTSLADIVVEGDDSMSQLHWELTWNGDHCEIRDARGVGGTFVGGRRIEREMAGDGAWIRAGRTDFRIYFEDVEEGGDIDLPETSGIAGELSEAWRAGDLFGILDAARRDRIVPMLRRAIDPHDCLYDGIARIVMEDCAPYVVRFDPSSPLLLRLLDAGWGDAWGVFGSSTAKLSELRAHFRRLVVVCREADGLPMYFRFYDPRVLRVFLPVATPRQRPAVFGPVERFVVEGPTREAVVFHGDGEPR